jgi:hypothetical protein
MQNHKITNKLIQKIWSYSLILIFFVLGIISITIYCQLLNSIFQNKLFVYIFMFLNYGFLYVFTNRYYANIKNEYKYIAILTIVIISIIPVIALTFLKYYT